MIRITQWLEMAYLSLQVLDMEAVVSGGIEHDPKSPKKSGTRDYLPKRAC